jgi:DNA-binding NtrC family response regulator
MVNRAKIMVVDDERMIRWSMQQALSKEGFSVTAVETGEEALSQAADDAPDLVLLDVTLPGIDGIEVLRRLRATDPSIAVIMVTADQELRHAVEAMRLGAYDYVAKPFDLDRVIHSARLALDRQELSQQVKFHQDREARKYGFHRIVGTSAPLRAVLEIARKVARSEAATVLIQGESGTGKDLLAQAIHFESSRAGRPFIPINCTALPGELLESELMGHEKGAFTDAKAAKKGLFEVADGGTIYLDEIGDMKPGLQAKLLRFIETKAFKRVGGHRDIEVDVRIVAATNIDLEGAVRDGSFREDLFYRLNVIPVYMPPLRDRREDVLPLADHFLSVFNEEFKRKVRGFSPETAAAMEVYDWPGNVRELRNVVERALILGEGEWLHFPDEFARPGATRRQGAPSAAPSAPPASAFRAAPPPPAPRDPEEGEGGGEPPPSAEGGAIRLPEEGVVLEEVERSFILQALDRHERNQTRAAQMLGLTRDTLRYRMKKFGISE